MAILLDKVNSAPIINDAFSYEFKQFMSNTVDTINENLNDMQGAMVSRETVSTTSINATVNSLYIPTSSSLTVFQLPQTTVNDVDSIIEIAGQGSGGWRILTAVGQTIKVASVGASASTSITSASRYDAIRIILVDASTWITLSAQTTGFVIV